MVGELGEWKYKLAVGSELILDLGDEDKGTGSGSNVVAPLLGLAIVRESTTLIPIVQHFMDYSGNEVSLLSLAGCLRFLGQWSSTGKYSSRDVIQPIYDEINGSSRIELHFIDWIQ
ncbi:MAG: hypothetical protein V7700_11080 [Halioglobus sp.]